jgi:hypothetical protein
MSFPCPRCQASVAGSPESWRLRCRACGSRLTSRALEATATRRLYEVQVAGRPETRCQVSVPWTGEDQQRLRRWLAWSSALTLGLVALLYLLARWAR